MSPVSRIVQPGVPLHITQRGTNRYPTFIADEDFAFYRWALGEASERAGCAVHAYALLTNHVHLLVTPSGTDSSARMMSILGRRYVRYFNDRHRRSGVLWGARYHSALVDDPPYFFDCHRYVEANPSRAGLVDVPRAYEWSSHRHNAFGEQDPIVTPHPLFLALGTDDDARRTAYRALFGEELDTTALTRIRAELRVAPKLASSPYHEAVIALIDRTHPST